MTIEALFQNPSRASGGTAENVPAAHSPLIWLAVEAVGIDIGAAIAGRTRIEIGHGRDVGRALAKVRAAGPRHEIAPDLGHVLAVYDVAELVDDVRPEIVLRAVKLALQGRYVVEQLNVVASGVVPVRNAEVQVDDALAIRKVRVAGVRGRERLIATRDLCWTPREAVRSPG